MGVLRSIKQLLSGNSKQDCQLRINYGVFAPRFVLEIVPPVPPVPPATAAAIAVTQVTRTNNSKIESAASLRIKPPEAKLALQNAMSSIKIQLPRLKKSS